MSQIILIPEGGLCNRMRAINAARRLADDLKAQLSVEWLENSDLKAPFYALFSAPVLRLRNRHRFYIIALIARWKRKSSAFSKLSKVVEKCFGIQIIDSAELLKLYNRLSPEELAGHISKSGTTYIGAWFGFYGDDNFTGFTPSPAVQILIDNITAKFDVTTVGIHIRRTDNAIAIANSPIELFIDKIRSYPADTTFFLATDCPQTKARLIELFPSRIITPCGALNRDSIDGMTQAAAELYTLSSCRVLLASHWSSFSDAAAQIGNISKIVIQNPPKQMELIIASANAHKISELSAIMPRTILLRSMAEVGITDDIPETAETLEGNALLKAHYIYSRTHKACFADDTGLEVEALNGAPGVHSARYAQLLGPQGAESHDASANVKLLLQNLENSSNRKARFRTVIALILDDGTEHLFEGVVNGQIIESLKGDEGFGYDPIFIPDGQTQTFAQMTAELKNTISHRALAAQKLIQFLEKCH